MPPATVTTAPSAPETSRVGLSTELIVDTACALISESHAEQLTMRRLSERLGVALGATYHHVPNREALLVLVADRINRRIRLESRDPRRWRSTLRAMMIDYAQAYAEHPGMAAFSLTNLAATAPDATHEQVVELLDGAGFAPDSARTVLAALFFYGNGATATDLVRRDQPGFPSSHLIRQFEHGLDLVLEGAACQLRADRRARRQADGT